MSETNWILEQDDGGENCVLSQVNENLIVKALNTCFMMLGDDEDRVVICMGSKDSKVVEIQTDLHAGAWNNYVFTKESVENLPEVLIVDKKTALQTHKNEILTSDEALDIVLYFYRTKKCHPQYQLIEKTYYWKKR